MEITNRAVPAMTFGTTANSRSLDPRTKLFILLLVNFTGFTISGFYLEITCMALVAVTMLYHRLYLTCLKLLSVYCLLWLLFFISMEYPNMLVNMLSVMFIMVRKMYPIISFGLLLIVTTRVGELIAALQKLHIPKTIIIPLVITLRFFPTMREEFASITDAMKVRGIAISFSHVLTHPLLVLEHILVPMILRLSVVAEELSAAAVARGIDCQEKRSSYFPLGFHLADGVFLLLFGAMFVMVLLSRWGVLF